MAVHAPGDPAILAEILTDAAARGRKVELQGGGSKARIGAERDCDLIEMSGFTGVVDYDPAELVLTVRAGTALAEVRELVASQGQVLAFDPLDPVPLTGCAAASPTIGGAVIAGFDGPGRLSGGAARDHLLGFQAVSGRGEMFRAGSKVVKNVTGFDLSKLIAGSWGRLAAVHELTLKVLPRPRERRTLALRGLNCEAACAAMATALGSPCEVNAAAYLPEPATTLIMLAGFGPSIDARTALLSEKLKDFGAAEGLDPVEADNAWRTVRQAEPLSGCETLWRIVVPPSAAPAMLAPLEREVARWLADWGGGVVWLALDNRAELVRRLAGESGGHAMLVRAPAEVWRTVSAWHPRDPLVARLEERVRRAFDPAGVFETDRHMDHGRAD